MSDGAKHIARILSTPGSLGVFEDTVDGIWVEQDGNDRVQRDYNHALTPEAEGKMREGYLCMYCYEPQSSAWADQHIPGCKGVLMHGPRFMRDRQSVEFSLRHEGDSMMGPQKPMRDFLDAQSERSEKRRWAIARAERGAEVPKEFLRDATLLGGE